MKNLSNSKAVKNLEMVIRAVEKNSYKLYEFAKAKGDEQRAEEYMAEVLALTSVLFMIEDKEHLQAIAEIHSVELLK